MWTLLVPTENDKCILILIPRMVRNIDARPFCVVSSLGHTKIISSKANLCYWVQGHNAGNARID